MIISILNIIKALFNSIYWFEIEKKKTKLIKKTREKLIIIKSHRDIKSSHFRNYFINFPSKINRLKKNFYFLVLVSNKKGRRKEILCSGWLYRGKKWKITEINKEVKINNLILLFDFLTPENLRNRGYYKKILELIVNKYRGKKLAIYSLSRNTKSLKAIRKAGFKLKRKINGI
tara:strand:+ start:636 stop:1157 length:522 start_codon:yes stop_codon:yes gene_type:complete